MTATPTDRAAIEAIARELTDEQWSDVFEAAAVAGTRVEVFCGPVIHHDTCRALLAYLDEVWAGLTTAQRTTLQTSLDGGGMAPLNGRTAPSLQARGLVYEHASWEGHYTIRPLGRAVLKRAKENGHV